MHDLLLGLVLGYLGLYFPNSRTLHMIKGERLQAVVYHVLASILWAFSIYYAAQLNFYFICGNIISGSIAIYQLTNKQRKNNVKLHE